MVSVIIVNFNGETLIDNCLGALNKQTYTDFEIIIVDNGSSDDSLKVITRFLQKTSMNLPVKIVPLGRNFGFAGGNIEGLRQASGDCIALLNNDTEPDARWLDELVRRLDTDSTVGICASKLVCYNSNNVDSAGDGFSRMLKGFKIGEGLPASCLNDQTHVFGACAGAALYRREMLEEIGFLDEDFFLIHEDTDFNFRAQLAGWKVLYVPSAFVYHKVRSSIGNMSDIAVYYSLRNSELVRIKNIPWKVLLLCIPELILGMCSEFWYFALKHGKLKLFIRAKKDALKMFPDMLRKRREIMKKRKVGDRYIYEMLTPVWEIKLLKAKFNKLING